MDYWKLYSASHIDLTIPIIEFHSSVNEQNVINRYTTEFKNNDTETKIEIQRQRNWNNERTIQNINEEHQRQQHFGHKRIKLIHTSWDRHKIKETREKKKKTHKWLTPVKLLLKIYCQTYFLFLEVRDKDRDASVHSLYIIICRHKGRIQQYAQTANWVVNRTYVRLTFRTSTWK